MYFEIPFQTFLSMRQLVTDYLVNLQRGSTQSWGSKKGRAGWEEVRENESEQKRQAPRKTVSQGEMEKKSLGSTDLLLLPPNGVTSLWTINGVFACPYCPGLKGNTDLLLASLYYPWKCHLNFMVVDLYTDAFLLDKPMPRPSGSCS